MADVYLAVVEGLAGFNKLLVLKLMRDTDDPEFLRMFLDEARLSARLQHPNVVQTYEVGQEGDTYFLTMEYINGATLLRLRALAAAEGGLPLPVSLHLLSQVLNGLHYAHNLKDYSGAPLEVVHRDMSPQNVMVSIDGECKILDFGIAKVMNASRHTRTGVFKGKIAYSSPEQVTTQPLDRRSDIFSVGVMLWEAIAGERLWGDLPSGEVMFKVAMGEIPSVLTVRPETPPLLAEICNRALARKPAERYATAAALADALDGFAATLGPPVTRRQVGELVTRLFAQDHERLRLVIENRLRPGAQPVLLSESHDKAVTSAGHTPPAAPQAPLSLSPSGPSPTASLSSPSGPSPHPSSPSVPSPPVAALSGDHASYVVIDNGSPPERPPVRRAWQLLAVTLAVAVPIAATLLWSRRAHKPEVVAPAVATSATSPASVSTPQSETAPAGVGGVREAPRPPAPSTVKLRLAAIPAGARLTLDGSDLGLAPFTGTYPKDNRAHVVGATMDGYLSMSSTVSFSEDVELELRLARAGLPAVAKKRAPSSSRRAAAAAAVAAPPPAVETPASRPKLEMGDALPARPRPKRSIDLDNPWSK